MKTREIAEFLGGELRGDGEVEITAVAEIHNAGPGDIAFHEKAGDIPNTQASCIIIREELNSESNRTDAFITIAVKNPKLAFARISEKFNPYESRTGWHESAVVPANSDIRASFIGAHVSIGESTCVGEATVIHDGVRIGRNVTVGKCSIIFPNVVIYDNVEIGNDCVIHAGAVIGADGFGYVRNDAGAYEKFPQIGTVVIEDDVEIGAGTCIDRGALGETRIGKGTKIDNLVQVGHNVQIGKDCVIAAQTGISGSVIIEDDCVIGGQVGFGDHVRVQSGAVIGSQAGVLPGKIVRPGVWWGTPIQPLDEYKRQNAQLKSIGRIKEELKRIKKAVADRSDD